MFAVRVKGILERWCEEKERHLLLLEQVMRDVVVVLCNFTKCGGIVS